MMKTTLKLGLSGLALMFAINLFGVFVLAQPATHFFSDGWWAAWFPPYVVWVVITIIGLGRRKKS